MLKKTLFFVCVLSFEATLSNRRVQREHFLCVSLSFLPLFFFYFFFIFLWLARAQTAPLMGTEEITSRRTEKFIF